MLRSLMKNVNNMQEQMVNVSRDRDSKNQNEILETKYPVTETSKKKNDFDELTSELNTV